MFLRFSWCFFSMIILLGTTCPHTQGEREYEANEVLIKFKPQADPAIIDSLCKEMGLKKVREFPRIGVTLYRIISGMTVEEVIERYKANPHIEYIEPNYRYRLD